MGGQVNQGPVSHDTLIHRFVRPPVRLAAGCGVTPNQLTTVRVLIGLGAAVAFATGARAWLTVGAGGLLLSLLLDRADGELARLTGRISPAGYRYDVACDFIGDVAAFAGLGVGVSHRMGPLAIWLGVLAGVSIVALFYMLDVAKLSTHRGVSAGGRVLVDPDDAMLLVPAMIWLGWAQAVVVIAGVVTPLVAVVMIARAAFRRVRSLAGR